MPPITSHPHVKRAYTPIDQLSCGVTGWSLMTADVGVLTLVARPANRFLSSFVVVGLSFEPRHGYFYPATQASVIEAEARACPGIKLQFWSSPA
jgi:hypothetical protein